MRGIVGCMAIALWACSACGNRSEPPAVSSPSTAPIDSTPSPASPVTQPASSGPATDPPASTALVTTTTLDAGEPLPRYEARAGDVSGHTLSGDAITMTFGPDGRWSANGGCNTMSGTFEVVAGRIVIGPGISINEMGCAADLHADDEWLMQLLAVAEVTTTGSTLSIVGPASSITMTDWNLLHPDLPLTGTLWHSNGFLDPSFGAYISSATFTVSLDEQSLRVEAACGSIDAAVAAIDDASIELGPPTIAELDCSDDERDQFADILRGLTSPSAYEINGGKLTFRQPDGFEMWLVAG